MTHFDKTQRTPCDTLAFITRVLAQYFIKVHNRGKFHQYIICGCQVKSFQSFGYHISIYKGPISEGVWDLTFPNMLKYDHIQLKFAPEAEFQQAKTVFEETQKFFF